MELDQRMLARVLAMNDNQLASLIEQIAKEAGVDPAMLGLNAENISEVRTALGNANRADLEKMNQIYQNYRENRRRK
jgi:hypothetical protein